MSLFHNSSLLLTITSSDFARLFVGHLSKIRLKLIPYFTRMIKLDMVGFEPTTPAMP
jgi:hypothetical protein